MDRVDAVGGVGGVGGVDGVDGVDGGASWDALRGAAVVVVGRVFVVVGER